MIRHVVMWKLKQESGHENALKIKSMLEELKPIIPEIKALEVGVNINGSDAAYDAVLISDFDNAADLQTYQNHPDHKAVSKFVASVRTDRVVVDFEI